MMRGHDNPSPLQSCEPDCSLPIKKCIPRREHLAQVMYQNACEMKGQKQRKITFQHAQTICRNIKISLILRVHRGLGFNLP